LLPLANVVASKSIEGLVTFLVAQAASADVHGRLLAVLVLGEVIKAASGDAQLAAALQALDFLAASKESLVGAELLIETLLETIVLKPSAAKTSQRAKLALLLALQAVDVPRVSEVVWLEQHATSPAARWATATYAMVNSADIPLEASGPLLRNLFKSLRDDTLLFLASVWTAPVDGSALVTGKLQAIALRHAEAFIQAHSQGTGSVDFQTVVPALLVALRSREKSVREGTIACLRLISAGIKDKAGVPYALDSVYGAASESVQLLKGQDVKRYLDTLLSDSASLVLDPAHIVSVHQDQMTIARGEAKKDVNYKRGVLCFLLSHVAAWSSTTARIVLLESAQAIRDASRIELLAPLLESMLSSAAMEASDEERKMAELTLDGYDRTAAVVFAERPEAWALFKQYLAVDASSAYGRDLRQLALLQLQTALFPTLPAPLQGEIVQTLVESVLDPAAAHGSDIKACLRALAPSSAIIVALLSALRPAGDSLRSSKRNKQDAESQAVVVRAFHAGLAVLLESRSVESLEGNADLLAALLDTLSALLDSKAKADVNVDYTEQLLLTGLCSVAAKLDQTTVDPQTIDVTVVMKILSDTKNPQTFQQALLLISQFARLAPLVVLQNALPIFVSVGAHTSQRDDAFTFQVVEKTVASILPVMVAHLKEEDVDRPRLWAKSLDILQVFIGMSQHVPAHRKTRLFSNLVQVLGPADFLGPIVMLLLNSYAQRPRSKGVDRASAFVLPSSVLNVFDLNSRFAAVLDLAVEAKTLLLHHVGSTAETSFLRQTSILPSTSITDDAKVDFRRASTILHFIQAVCQQLPSVALSDDESRSVQATVAALLPIGFVSGQDSQVEGLPELAQASQDALDAIIRTLSVPAFAASIEPMLAGDDVEVRRVRIRIDARCSADLISLHAPLRFRSCASAQLPS
jgi:U3 small nucleolar RNA-associated protein 10